MTRDALARRDATILPALIVRAGMRAQKRFVEFFTAEIRNRNTRIAYGEAVRRFCEWCDEKGLQLERVEPVHVAAYIETLLRELAAPSVKQHLAAIRRLFDYLVVGQAVPYNPAAAVRGPKASTQSGKTPAIPSEAARRLLDSIDTKAVVGLRDRAVIAVMIYSFARVGAVTRMKVKDYYTQGRRAWFRLHEKGEKYLQVPAHHKAMEYVDAYLSASGVIHHPKSPLFRSSYKKTGALLSTGLTPNGVLRLIKRRAKDAGLPAELCCHSCRATGITAFLEGGGDVETAQYIAGHKDPRTTKLYDRRQAQLTQDEIERIRI